MNESSYDRNEADAAPHSAFSSPPPLPETPLETNRFNTSPIYEPPPVKTPNNSWASSCLRSCMMMSFIFVVGCILFFTLIFRAGCSVIDKTKSELKSSSFQKILAENFESMDDSAEDADDGKKRVLKISINGIIQDAAPSSSWYSEDNSAQAALMHITKAKDNKKIKGILIQINSGGGGITASDVIWNSLVEFKKADTNRVIVVMMGSMAASGAYYISAAADYIVANPTTLTGSIGVIMNSYNVQDLAARIGLKSITIKSGGNKDILNPFTELTPEQEQMLQHMVDSLHTRFVNIVADGRGLDVAKVRAIADGRILLATEAVSLGLIDQVGYLEDAKTEMARRLEAEPKYIDPAAQPPFFKFFRSPSFWGECISHAIKVGGDDVAQSGGITIK